jgi:hypothetical protein
MVSTGTLLMLLILSPLVTFLVHAVAHRALGRAGLRPTAHSSAAVALAGAFAILVGTGWRLGAFGDDPATALCAFAYVATVSGALGILYLDVVNIAETSLHMHVLLELAWNDGMPVAELLERYGAERMITTRIERLASLGQVRIADGRCYIANRGTLYLAGGVDWWRSVLGLPAAPPLSESEQP